MSNVVVISSDEEGEPSRKKSKLTPTANFISIKNEQIFAKLDKLPEITAENVGTLTKGQLKSLQNLQRNSVSIELIDDKDEEAKPAVLEDPSPSLALNVNPTSDTNLESIAICGRTEVVPESDTVALDTFISGIKQVVQSTRYEDKVSSHINEVYKLFQSCADIHDNKSFKKMLQDYLEVGKHSPENACHCFVQVHNYLKDIYEMSIIEVAEDKVNKVRKLELTMGLLVKKIQKLEEREVDFDHEENSNYMKLDLYSRRLDLVFKKYCKYLKVNPHRRRLMYSKLSYTKSEYSEINEAISKTFKPLSFPTYYEIEKCVKECVSSNNLTLDDYHIKKESKLCFETLGNLLQSRRKKDLYDAHTYHLATIDDPARNYPALDKTLRENRGAAEARSKKIIAEYAQKQESYVDPSKMSTDSDDSHRKNSDSDN